MKALVKTAPGPGNLELIDVPEPNPSPRQVKVEVSACGICGTDLHVMKDTFRNFPPVILGHEFVGRVVEEGEEVVGMVGLDGRYAVLGATAIHCGACAFCRSGDFMFCPTRRGMGHGVDGAFCRYVCVRPDQLFRIDDGLPEEEGALVEPLAVAVRAVAETARVRPGDVALVSGPGPIGLLCLIVLAQQGVPTIVAGARADGPRLRLAEELGAIRVVDTNSEDLVEVAREATSGRGVDVAFETAGVAASAAACLEALRPMGCYVQVGHFGNSVELPIDHIGYKQLHVAGSIGYTTATWNRTLQLLARKIMPSRIITHRLPLDAWQSGFKLFDSKEAVKVLLKP